MNKRILILAASASTHTWRYLKAIAAHVDEIVLISNQLAPEHSQPDNLRATLLVNFSFRSVWITPRIINTWLIQQYPSLASKNNSAADCNEYILHIHQANSVCWHVLRASKNLALKKILTCWGSDILLLPKRTYIWRKMVQYNLSNVDWISADSLNMAAEIRKLLNGKKQQISVINYGIDALPSTEEKQQYLPQILSCRLHKPLYRIDLVLRAWQRIESACTPWKLAIAANGEQTKYLETLAIELKLQRVKFYGFVDANTLQQLYQNSSIFLSIPSSDASSVSLLEAMSHGCLPLLSNLAANLEWVIDEINGLIAENCNITELAKRIQQAIKITEDTERMTKISTFNRKLIQQKGLQQQNIKQFAELYQQLQTK